MFILIPTLVFQLAYPLSNKRSYIKFALKILLYILLLMLWVTIIMEYWVPLVEEWGLSIKQERYLDAFYHFIRLAAPNTYSWLIMFFGTFHVYLNAFADLTGFTDKNFYEDWWNSKSLGEYWRKWNLPVHNWLTRHIYFPLIRRKYSRMIGMMVVFFFSAVMHEYILIGWIGSITMIGFNSMAFQLPFIILQDRYKKYLGGDIGNITFWFFFWVIGQPAGMVIGYLWRV